MTSINLTEEEYEIARAAVEYELVQLRDDRISLLLRGNGLCIRESDGTESSTIRMGMEDALIIAIAAINKNRKESSDDSHN